MEICILNESVSFIETIILCLMLLKVSEKIIRRRGEDPVFTGFNKEFCLFFMLFYCFSQVGAIWSLLQIYLSCQ